MTRVRLLDLGQHLSSRDRAANLREELLRELGDEPGRITIDLQGVRSVSDSFADELLAVLAWRYGAEWFREHIVLENATPDVRATILRTIKQRVEPSDEPEGVSPPPPPQRLAGGTP